MLSTVIPNVTIDRPHRFTVGALVRHVDSPATRENIAVVNELTYRVTFDSDGQPVAYPTYTLTPYRDEEIEDVLCDLDLIGAYETARVRS